ncbi:class C beta-lactamase-related serine hydrolase [Flavobacteriaceae bacterium AU392]|nr:class C beta-lactamase-related serine hydrolase [Flavobacteriaceae bacterium]RKM83691.1 class C beta-lactamase-related serine hydrolase [Flavobacteriaceae bacterium AU392]
MLFNGYSRISCKTLCLLFFFAKLVPRNKLHTNTLAVIVGRNMKYILLLTFYLLTTNVFSQINFEEKSIDETLYNRALSADSAIKKGEFGTVHSLLIVKNGKVLFENYYNEWTRDSIHQLQSATKSVISTLLGCALQKGIIKNENDLISDYFKQYSLKGNLKQQITISDLLTQRHGFQWKEGAWEDPNNTWRKIISKEGDWYKKILDTPMDTTPGTKFVYSNAAPTLISGLIQSESKMAIDSFAIHYLFEPLDIKNYWFWQGNGKPENNGMPLISLTSRDMAKIGQLYLQNGRWNNQQILPENYVKTATSSIVTGVGLNGAYKQYDYGYFWWSNPISQSNKKTNVFLARGAGGQNIIVSRKENLIIVTTAWNMQQPNKVQLIYDWYLSN